MSFSTIIFLLVIALILFGPEDLPVIARALGKIFYQVRKAADELTKEFEDALDTPKTTLKQAVDNVVSPDSPKREKLDKSEWKQEQGDNKDTEKELVSYDVDEENNKVEKAQDDPLLGLPEEILTYDNKDISKKDVSR